MFKQLFLASIIASLLISLPSIADHHHHHEKEKMKEKVVEKVAEKFAEKLAEEKAKEKTGSQKWVAGLAQFVNNNSPYVSGAIGLIVAYAGPFYIGTGTIDRNVGRAIEGLLAGVVSWRIIKPGTEAFMSQEDIKPLKK